MIHAQMAEHFWERVTEYDVKVSRGFTELKNCAFTYLPENERDVRDTVEDLGRIRQLVFGGFARCLYRLQKFDSGTERRVALILDRDTQRWFRPVRGQFQIYYKLRAEQPEYVPDFVAETDEELLMIEAKARDEMTTPEVLAKATAATAWCSHATRYNAENNGKPWRYLLIPHDQVSEAARPVDLRRFEFASMADD